MLLEGRCDDVRLGPVVDVAIGASGEWAYRNQHCLSWVRGAFDRYQECTSVSRDLRYDLNLRENDGVLRVILLFRERPDGRPVLFVDVEIDEISTFNNRRHAELLRHDPEIQVVFGRNVLDHGNLVMFPDDGNGWSGTFLFSVDTGTGITPVTGYSDD